MKETILDRRKFLKSSLSLSAGAMAFGGLLPKALAATCGLTPPQVEGPFYPGEAKFTPVNDLTILPGATQRAIGQVAYVTGLVQDQHCLPLDGATVEIWQACASGRYNNVKDDNPAPLDPHFRYWGEAISNHRGEYEFKTIIPGAYPNDPTWTRPAHIHFKVTKKGYRELITQMYFKGDPYLDRDLILQNLPREEQEQVVVEFKPARLDREPGAVEGEFNIRLRSVR
jgi:protocatechuate 3,4-dioxygenase beta subunit